MHAFLHYVHPACTADTSISHQRFDSIVALPLSAPLCCQTHNLVLNSKASNETRAAEEDCNQLCFLLRERPLQMSTHCDWAKLPCEVLARLFSSLPCTAWAPVRSVGWSAYLRPRLQHWLGHSTQGRPAVHRSAARGGTQWASPNSGWHLGRSPRWMST